MIGAQNPFIERSLWDKDIEDNNIAVRYLPLKYPKVLLQEPRSIFSKIAYKIALSRMRSRTKGNYYDRALLWEGQATAATKALINEKGINNVVVTGPPFHNMHHLLKIKEDHREVNLIADFRDPWTTGKRFGIGTIDANR